MRPIIGGMALLAALAPFAIHAQQSEPSDKIGQGIMVIREFCGTQGNQSKEQNYVGQIEGGITLRKLPGISGGGKLEYTTKEAQGLAGALFKELTDNATSLSKAQIECMSPFISRILDSILGSDTGPNKPQEADLTDYQVPSHKLFCDRLHKVIDSYKDAFKSISYGSGGIPGQYKTKLVLPNTQWCSISIMPFINYSCSFYYNENNTHNASIREQGYRKAISECLGDKWAASDVLPNNYGGFYQDFEGDPGYPKVELRSSKNRDGADLTIYIEQP